MKYNGDETELAREISNGVSINLLTNGNSVMNAQGAGKDLGTFFNELVADLDKHDEASIADLSKKLGEVDVFKNNIVNYNTRIGAIENRHRCGQRSQRQREDNAEEHAVDAPGR